METIDITLPLSSKVVKVVVDRKRMKTCRLKVYPDISVVIAVPLTIPTDWIQNFLIQKSGWIEKKLEKFTKTTGYAATTEIRNGQSIKMLGEDLIFSVSASNKCSVYKEGKAICISSFDINHQEKLLQLFEKWWRKEALRILQEKVEELYPIIGKYGIDKPSIALRKMKTLWGSCSVNRKTITFNQYLIKAKPACIEYVVLHELVHFLYPNHSKQFYDFLSIHMPDWKERKKILDLDVVHGL
ncbi:MAG: M48 family metallopeptidase [Clostridia bacterium]|jgi:predicted metal-dependent hydrolase|nr:M48 family metallopeptidase [Clostridia bacterium]MCI2013635.1 M48 family metallopeptidase [Clostridia bacterium]